MFWTVVQNEVSQKDKNILYINTRIWNLEKWYRGRGSGRNWETGIDMYTLLIRGVK